MQCVFSLPEGAAEKYQIVYDGQKTYAFAMSNKYILGLFTHCEAARKSAVEDGVEFVHLPENEQKIVSLENVRNVLFQALLLDNVTVENGLFHAQMCEESEDESRQCGIHRRGARLLLQSTGKWIY